MGTFTPQERVPLAPHTTFELGGPARFFAEVNGRESLEEAFAWAEGRCPVVMLGGGSNVLVADAGLDALVLRLVGGSLEQVAEEGEIRVVRAGAGVPWDDLVERSVAWGLAGLECLSGIPGSTGATPIQNVGAYGQEVGQVTREVEVYLPESHTVERWSPSQCAFAYRDSAFKRRARGTFVVLGVSFALHKGGPPALRYAELARQWDPTERPSLSEVRARVLELRRLKSMVIDPADENRRSAGSFFTNPIIASSHAPAVAERARARSSLAAGESMPAFPAGDGTTKLSAGWLIERAGFPRGTARGAVGLSSRHALALVNRGGATSADVIAFAREVRDGVLEQLGVRLTPEPELLGFSAEELGDLLAATAC